MPFRTLFFSLLLSLATLSQVKPPLGYSIPGKLEYPGDANIPETYLRSSHELQLLLCEGENFEVSIHTRQVGSYDEAANYRVTDASGTILREGRVPPKATEVVRLPNAVPGLYDLKIAAGLNAVSVRSPMRYMITNVGKARLQMIYAAAPQYFYVPAGVREYSLKITGGGSKEAVQFSISDNAGKLALEGDDRTNRGLVKIVVPPGQDGKIWSVSFAKYKDVTFEDFKLEFVGDLVPVVADHPSRLFLPAMQTFSQPLEDGAQFGIQLYSTPEQLRGSQLKVRIDNLETGKTELDETITQFRESRVAVVLQGKQMQRCHIEGVLCESSGKEILRVQESLAVAHGKNYLEIENVETHPVSPPSFADVQTGYQVFARQEPGDIRPNSYPREEELLSEIKATVAPAEFETLYFALYPLRDLKKAIVDVEDFVGDSGVIPAANVEIRSIRCWPQRRDWSSREFHVIPELLEEFKPLDLQKRRPQQFALVLKTPDNAKAGTYTSRVSIRTDKQVSRPLTLNLNVLPFKLRQPRNITWGLYPDSARWTNFPEAQVRAEMVDFKNHGINALMLYPLISAEWSWEAGKLHADFREIRRQIRLHKEVGFPGINVISIQSGESRMRKLAGAGNGEEAYTQLLKIIRQEAEDDSWPEFCLHSVDEPGSGEKLQRAFRTLERIKKMGFRTFNTCYGNAVRDVLDPVLDFRCYNNIAFGSFRTQEKTERLRQESLAANDHLWFYGTGCYTNGGLIEDGNVVVNRYMGGFHFWRSKATGCWAWTLLRAKGNVYDDFDGNKNREAKEACTVYPNADNTALIPTLQWEGIREGVDDYKYIYTLTEMIAEAKASGKPAAQKAAVSAQAEIDKLFTDMPWTCRAGALSNGDVNRARALVIAEAQKVWSALQ